MMYQVLLILLVTSCFANFTLDLNSALMTELLHPDWQEVVAAGGMSIGHGRAKRFVELSNSEPNVPHQRCLLPDGKNGHCRHLHYCIQEDFKRDFTKFMDYLCIIKHSSIGVCCSDSLGSGSETAVAGDLPATALKDENEVSIRIDRFGADTRGCGLSTKAQGKRSGPAAPRDWPWMALVTPDLEDIDAKFCGGSLITDRHVLTAAHCTREYINNPEKLFVRLGEYDMERTDDSRSYNFRIVEIRQHELYEIPNNRNDISIVKLHRPAVFNTYIWPICLPPPGLEYTNEIVSLTGWGSTAMGQPTSPILLEVSVPVWDHPTCVNAYAETIFNETICAGGREGGKDACQHDSGGPLMYQMASGRWAVIGIVSWGQECGKRDHPGVYIRVDSYLDWILQNAQF